ncbi:MAG: hypothetical protein U0T82_18030 [Bacteroidales bacterium]
MGTFCETGDKDKKKKWGIDPRFECRKCREVSHKEKHLCKPRKLKEEKSS